MTPCESCGEECGEPARLGASHYLRRCASCGEPRITRAQEPRGQITTRRGDTFQCVDAHGEFESRRQ